MFIFVNSPFQLSNGDGDVHGVHDAHGVRDAHGVHGARGDRGVQDECGGHGGQDDHDVHGVDQNSLVGNLVGMVEVRMVGVDKELEDKLGFL